MIVEQPSPPPSSVSVPVSVPIPSSSQTSSSSPSSSRLSLGLPRSKGGRPMLIKEVGEDSLFDTTTTDGTITTRPLTGLELRRQYEDESIRGTDGDALGSRLSAIQAGYFTAANTGLYTNSNSNWTTSGDPWSHLFSAVSGQGTGAPASAAFPSSLHPSASSTASSRTESDNQFSSSSEKVVPPSLRPIGPPPVTRRPPIINIGTFLRCERIDALVEDFLLAEEQEEEEEIEKGSGDRQQPGKTKGKGRQIVSVGAGSDARYWRIMSNARLAPHLSHYLELDFPQVVMKKLAAIQRFAKLQEHLVSPATSPQDETSAEPDTPEGNPDMPLLHTQSYTLQSCDLRLLSSSSSYNGPLTYLDSNVPTLILAECVLAYMPPEASVKLLRHIASKIDQRHEVRGVCYEMCVAGDELALIATQTAEGQGNQAEVSKFGKVMLKNLETRGLSLQGARAFPTPSSHAQRFREAFTLSPSTLRSNLPLKVNDCSSTISTTTASSESDSRLSNKQMQVEAQAISLRQIWQSLPALGRERLSRMEGLDEVEELMLLLSCYCLSWATRPACLQGSSGTIRS